MRGALAIVTTCGEMRWTRGSDDERSLPGVAIGEELRTAKSIGSDTPMQASTPEELTLPREDGGTESRVTRTISYKP